VLDLQPLVDNPGFADGDALILAGAALSQRAIQEQLPALARRGVKIEGVEIAQDDPVVVIPDTNLERVIRQALGKSGGALTSSDLATMTTLEAPDEGIYDLAGIEHCANLTTLDLSRNSITDPSTLASLTVLKILRLSSADLPDLGFLARLARLETLWIGGNELTDLGGLSHLARLSELIIEGNPIRDLSPLGRLPDLRSLFYAHADPDD
jgi:internalin A